MALAVEQHWPAQAPLEGLVITRYGHGLLTNRLKVIEAGHPVPDEAGEAAAKEILRAVAQLSRRTISCSCSSPEAAQRCCRCLPRASAWKT